MVKRVSRIFFGSLGFGGADSILTAEITEFTEKTFKILCALCALRGKAEVLPHLIPETLFFFFFLSGWVVIGCASTPQRTMVPTSTLIPTTTATPSQSPAPLPTLSPTPEPRDTGWTLSAPGLERRRIRIDNDQNQHIESLYMWRLDQSRFRLDVGYHETPQSLESWQKETNAFLVVNGGYFRTENEKHFPDGLTIANGQAFGSSYESFAGMLVIREEGAELRWLAQKPYDPKEPILAGLQSFPLLVKPGGELGFPAQSEDNLQARRTAIAQDKDGRILFMVTPRGRFTLHQLSVYLTESDLDLDIALNLDGGPSTGILVASPQEIIPSQVLLPIVILVHAR
jgi:hypothetical protein